MAAFSAAQPAAATELAELWRLALVCWHDPKCHDKLLQLAREHDAYPWLAARYREVARARAADPIATAHLARLQRIAAHTLLLRAPVEQTRPRPYRSTRMLLLVLVAAMALGIVHARVEAGASAAVTRVSPR